MHALVTVLVLAAGTFDAAMAKAVALYNEAEWDLALRELTAAEKLATSDAQKSAVWLHQGIVLANVPDADRARAAWRRALELDVSAQLPLPVSPRVRALFDETKAKVKAAPRPPPADAPANPALTPRERPANVPGYAQSRFPVVPLVSLGVALVSGGVGIGMLLMADATKRQERAAPSMEQMNALRSRGFTETLISNIAFGIAGAAALVALITFIVME